MKTLLTIALLAVVAGCKTKDTAPRPVVLIEYMRFPDGRPWVPTFFTNSVVNP